MVQEIDTLRGALGTLLSTSGVETGEPERGALRELPDEFEDERAERWGTSEDKGPLRDSGRREEGVRFWRELLRGREEADELLVEEGDERAERWETSGGKGPLQDSEGLPASREQERETLRELELPASREQERETLRELLELPAGREQERETLRELLVETGDERAKRSGTSEVGGPLRASEGRRVEERAGGGFAQYWRPRSTTKAFPRRVARTVESRTPRVTAARSQISLKVSAASASVWMNWEASEPSAP